MKKPLSIALLSGGLDSSTATALALEANHNVIALSFDYGQKHSKELTAAVNIAKHLNIEEHYIIEVNLAAWGGSSLTDNKQNIPIDGIKKNMIPNTYVPGRNTVFIAIGLSLAEAKEANNLLLGVNIMDYSGYPDCRPDYLQAYQDLANLSSKMGRSGQGVQLLAPLMKMGKLEIIKEAIRLDLPIEKTWSCYKGEQQPCGVCDSCRIRDAGLKQAGRLDLCSL